jgi:hypothetical protein
MHARNAGLQRLRSITKRVGIATTVLTGVFAGLAAAGNSGHHHKRSVATSGTTTTETSAPASVPAPPGLPPLQGDGGQAPPAPAPAPEPAPTPPAAPPVQTQQLPVVTSGGS